LARQRETPGGDRRAGLGTGIARNDESGRPTLRGDAQVRYGIESAFAVAQTQVGDDQVRRIVRRGGAGRAASPS
jgi:hypothetical protein